MMADVERQLQDSDSDNEEIDIFTNVVPNVDTKALGRRLMEQLKQNWKAGTIEKRCCLLRTRFVFPPAVGRLFQDETAQRVLQAQERITRRHPTTMMAMMPWRPDNDEIELE
jgi:hypothetical protein